MFHLRNLRKQQSGAAAVEFAMVFPLLLFLIFLMIDIARLLLLNMALQTAATEGAQQASKAVTRNISAIKTAASLTMPDAISNMADAGCGDTASCLSVLLTNNCSTTGLVTVTAQESFQFLAPDAVVFSFFIRGTAGNGLADIHASSTALCLD